MSAFAILRIKKHKTLASVYHVARHHSDHAFVDRLVSKLEQSPTRHDIRDFLPLLQEYKARVAIVH